MKSYINTNRCNIDTFNTWCEEWYIIVIDMTDIIFCCFKIVRGSYLQPTKKHNIVTT